MLIMSVNKVSSKESSTVNVNILRHPTTTKSLITFRKIIRDSFGPNGKAALIHNNSGGHVTITTSCLRLLSSLSISKPLLKLITSAAKQHLNRHHDNGLLMLLLATELIIRGLESDLPQSIIPQVFDLLSPVCSEYLNRTKTTLDTSCVDGLLSVITALLSSKPLCLLSCQDRTWLAQTLLKVVVSGCTAVRVMCLEGIGPAESQLIDGVLLPAPQDSLLHNRNLKFALFNISLSGDTEDLPDMEYQLNSANSLTDSVVEQISGLLPVLVTKGVTLVLCQKVIHPTVKRKLKAAGISSVERLGLEATRQVQSLTGCALISSFVNSISDEQLGMIDGAELMTLEQKRFLRLFTSSDCRASTLVLCHRSEEAVNELRSACESAIHTTRQLLIHPFVLKGSGQWQNHLANHIDEKVAHEKASWSEDLGCCPLKVLNSSALLSSSLRSIASLLPSDGSVDDALIASEAAVRTALGVAALVLGVHTSIEENV